MVGHVECFLVGTQGEPIGRLYLPGNLVDLSICIDPVDGSVLELPLFVPHVSRIAEVDSAFSIDGQVIGGIEALARELAGDGGFFSGFDVPGNDLPLAEIRALAPQQPAG